MIQIILFKRGRSGVVEQYTGPSGELVYDRGRKALRLHDETKLGGHLLRSNAVATERPVITSPSNGAVDLPRQFTITAAPYTGDGEHTATRWQASLDPAMSESVMGTDWDTDNVRTVQVTAPANSDVYLRCQFQIDGEWATGWSETVQAKITAEWLTFFTADRQTSHLTEISRTTSVTTQLLGYKQTFSINSRQTYVEGGNYSRNTSRSTSTSWSTNHSSPTTRWQTNVNGSTSVQRSTSFSTGVGHNTNMLRWQTDYQFYTNAWATMSRVLTHNVPRSTYVYENGQRLHTIVYVDHYTHKWRSTTGSKRINTSRYTEGYTSWVTYESYRTTSRSTSSVSSTSWNTNTSKVTNLYRSTSRSTATAALTSWQVAGGYQNVYETNYWQTATYSPAQTEWVTTFNSATYYETQVETSVYTS